MSRRLVVLSEIIAPYRIPVFNALAREREIDLHVIFLAETDPALRRWRVYKDEIRFSYEVLPAWRRRVGKHNLLLNRGLGAALRRAHPSAILCGGYNYISSWHAAWWAHRHGVPLLVWVESTARDSRGRRIIVESLKRRFLHGCKAFVVAGKSSCEYLKTYDLPEAAIFPAPNAVDTEFFAREAGKVRINAEPYRLALGLPSRFYLFAGRIVPEKGVYDLLEAYDALSPELRSAVALVYVGEGWAREGLEQRAARIQPGKVQFAGFAQRETLAAYYALADALVFPTHSDPWGLVVNEAMTCGRPIITTDAAGCAPDLVTDGWNGLIVPAGNVPRLAGAMSELARSASVRTTMGENSRFRIRDYSPQNCASGIARAMLCLDGAVA